MDDVLSFHTRVYSKSDEIKEIKLWKRVIIVVQALPILIIKLFIVIIALIFEWFNQIFHCFVPKPLNDIRGQLAVVSAKITTHKNITRMHYFPTHTYK